jgi:hypothetical protein
MLRKLSKKHLAALAFVGALAITGVSVAYFSGGTGSVTGSGTVGTSSPWNVTLNGTPTWSGGLTAIYPGVGTESIPFRVTNGGNGNQALTSIVPAVSHDTNGYVISNGAPLTGCLATWFHVAANPSNPALGSSIAPGSTYDGNIDLTMQDFPASQDLCKSAAPAITITAS